MIIWRGWGGLLALAFVIGAIFAGYGIGALFFPNAWTGGDLRAMFLSLGLGFVIAGIVMYLVTNLLLRKQVAPQFTVTERRAVPGQVGPDGQPRYEVQPVINPKTHKPRVKTEHHALFFIPVVAFPFILAALGLISIALSFFG